jgi:Tfp pilus assembly protein PilN
LSARQVRIGIAIGDDVVVGVATAGGASRAASVPLQWPDRNDGVAAAVAAAFNELAAKLAAESGTALDGAHVRIALLPPLADARLVPLPPLRLREAEAVVRRDAARHFVGGAVARAVAVLPAASGADVRSGERAVLAAAAPVATLESVRAAAAGAGWTVESIVPAHGAWLAGPETGWSGDGARSIFAAHGDAVHVMRIEGESLVTVRRVPASLVSEVVSAAGAAPGRAIVCGEAGRRESLSRAVAAAGWTLVDDAARSRSAPEVAAMRAHRSPLELVPPSLTAERWRRSRMVGRRLAASAVVLLAVAAAIEFWGMRRELDAVRARRAEIRSEVSPLLATRDSINQMESRTQAIREIERSTPRWTRALFDLALLLPSDSYLTSVRTRGDTLVIEGSGASAGEAMQALRRAGSLTDFRLEGIVERDLEDGSTSIERFRLSARLKPPLGAARPSILDPKVERPPPPTSGDELGERERIE